LSSVARLFTLAATHKLMKRRSFLLIPLLAVTLCPALFADDTKEAGSIDARLKAVELQLDRIEHLLRASTPVAAQPDDEPGRIRVTILGQVNVPGVYSVDTDAPIGSLIALAGGFTRIADATRVSVWPTKGAKIKINSSDPRAYKLKAGDIMTVGEGWF
jgi:hypothetical protein